MRAPSILLVNPWITDFAAFDLWAKPLGLLQLASLLREGGCEVTYLDCLDRHDPMTNTHPEVQSCEERRWGTGKFPKMPIKKPRAYAGIPRNYYRHGLHPDSLRRKLNSIPNPDLIWMTSIMTYWYPGIKMTVEVIRDVFPEVPIWLGGIYARLCTQHARTACGVTEVVTLPVSMLPKRLEAATNYKVRNPSSWEHPHAFPLPALDLIAHPTYAPIAVSSGCPFQCPYCASRSLQPRWERRKAQAIYGEVTHWRERLRVSDFAFYDDALLLQAEDTLKPALQRIVREDLHLRFHTPNALHIRAISPAWSTLLHQSGFTTLRLGLETTTPERQEEWGGKVQTEMFFKAVENLRAAGFSRNQIGVYLLCGLPRQTPEEVADAIRIVHRAGAQPYLAEYSPIPGTPLWPEACSMSPYDLSGDPLYHNNSFFACRRPDFSYDHLMDLKDLARWIRLQP